MKSRQLTQEAVEMHPQGITQKKIAKITGLGFSTVGICLKKLQACDMVCLHKTGKAAAIWIPLAGKI